jgi:LuxR family maltose regulon positive regulatory protein
MEPQLLATKLYIALINHLAAVPNPFALVLDDYHTIAVPSIHEGAALLLEHQPLHLHFVIMAFFSYTLLAALIGGWVTL